MRTLVMKSLIDNITASLKIANCDQDMVAPIKAIIAKYDIVDDPLNVVIDLAKNPIDTAAILSYLEKTGYDGAIPNSDWMSKTRDGQVQFLNDFDDILPKATTDKLHMILEIEDALTAYWETKAANADTFTRTMYDEELEEWQSGYTPAANNYHYSASIGSKAMYGECGEAYVTFASNASVQAAVVVPRRRLMAQPEEASEDVDSPISAEDPYNEVRFNDHIDIDIIDSETE